MIKTILFLPFYVLSVFTGAKNFAKNPVIGSPSLNRLGLHRIRLMLSAQFHGYRQWFLKGHIRENIRHTYEENGFIVEESAISAQSLAEITHEIDRYRGPARRMIQGDTMTDRILLTPAVLARMPHLKRVISDPRLRRLLHYTGGIAQRPIFYIQRIHNMSDSDSPAIKPDPQKTIHSDTFHPTMKAWLFLEDVTEDKGPFTYVRGSSRFSFARANYETEVALNYKERQEPYSGRGSIRLDDQSRARLDYPTPEGLTAKAGTLVIANTHGYHGRGQAADGATRLEIFAYSRTTPFWPLPFWYPDPFYLTERLLAAWHRYQDKRHEKRNSLPTWRLIDAQTMLSDNQADIKQNRTGSIDGAKKHG